MLGNFRPLAGRNLPKRDFTGSSLSLPGCPALDRRFLAKCSKIKRTSVNVDIESGIVAMFGRGRSEDQLLAMLRGQLTDIVLEQLSCSLFIGLTACSIAAVRRRSGVRLIVWLRIWS